MPNTPCSVSWRNYVETKHAEYSVFDSRKIIVLRVMIPRSVNGYWSSFLIPILSSSILLNGPIFRREHWKLLSSLKTTVEGLVSTNNPNVWSRYGGLQRLHKDMNSILSHGLKNEQVGRRCLNCCQFSTCLFFWCSLLIEHFCTFAGQSFAFF